MEKFIITTTTFGFTTSGDFDQMSVLQASHKCSLSMLTHFKDTAGAISPSN
jgi:hypothetical protein